MIRVKRQQKPRIFQGDIFRDIEYIEYVTEKSGTIEVSKIVFPVVIVLTQDCDLAQDYKFRWSRNYEPKTQDKWLLSVLVAPLYNAEHAYRGEHLSELDIKMEPLPTIKKSKPSSSAKVLHRNENPRYHYLEFPDNVPIVPSFIDFKHYFSVHIITLKNLKKTHFVCRVSDLYREDISQRFANFLARIGLP